MPDTIDTTIRYTLSEDGQPDVVRTWTRQVVANELIGGMVVEVPTSGYVLDLSPYTLDSVFIRNRGSNPCLLSWELVGEALTFNSPTNEIGFAVGPPETITIVTGSFTFTANYKAAEFARVTGASNASNNGDFVIEAVPSNTVLELGSGAGLVADSPDTGSPVVTRVQKRRARIDPGGWYTLRGTEITGSLTLKGQQAQTSIEAWVFGT